MSILMIKSALKRITMLKLLFFVLLKPLKQFIDTDSLSLVSVDDIAADKAITIGKEPFETM